MLNVRIFYKYSRLFLNELRTPIEHHQQQSHIYNNKYSIEQ